MKKSTLVLMALTAMLGAGMWGDCAFSMPKASAASHMTTRAASKRICADVAQTKAPVAVATRKRRNQTEMVATAADDEALPKRLHPAAQGGHEAPDIGVLPIELYEHIASYCNLPSAFKLAATCRTLRRLVQNEDALFWHPYSYDGLTRWRTKELYHSMMEAQDWKGVQRCVRDFGITFYADSGKPKLLVGSVREFV